MNQLTALFVHRNWVEQAPGVDIELAKWFAKKGVDHEECENMYGPLRSIPILLHEQRAEFEIADRGPAAVVHMVDDERGKPSDLAAWLLSDPNSVNLYLGDGALLGADQVLNPVTYYGGQPLQIHRTPLEWLQAGCDGVAILSATNARSLLGRALGPVAAQNEAHARSLHNALAPALDKDQILFPADERVAA